MSLIRLQRVTCATIINRLGTEMSSTNNHALSHMYVEVEKERNQLMILVGCGGLGYGEDSLLTCERQSIAIKKMHHR